MTTPRQRPDPVATRPIAVPQKSPGQRVLRGTHRSRTGQPPVRSGIFAAVALAPGVFSEVAVERSLELVYAVSGSEPQKNLSTLGRDAWITGAVSPTAFLEKVLANAAHALHSAATRARLVGRISYSINYPQAVWVATRVCPLTATGDCPPMAISPRIVVAFRAGKEPFGQHDFAGYGRVVGGGGLIELRALDSAFRDNRERAPRGGSCRRGIRPMSPDVADLGERQGKRRLIQAG